MALQFAIPGPDGLKTEFYNHLFLFKLSISNYLA